MANKPSDVPRWADVGGDIVEPASGKKDIGWVSDELPPAQWFNWWMNVVGEWFKFFTQRFFDGPVSGDLEVTGVDVTTGTDVDGGDLVLSGGSSTGSGHSKSAMHAAVAGVSGTDVRTPEAFIEADGDSDRIVTPKTFEKIEAEPTSGNQIAITGVGSGTGRGGFFRCGPGGGVCLYAEGNASAVNATAIQGQGKGTGQGVVASGSSAGGTALSASGAFGTNGRGATLTGQGTGAGARVSNTTGDGYALDVLGDGSSPTKSAARLQPQPEASTPDAGALQVVEPGNKLIFHDGNDWNRPVAQVYANDTISNTISDTVAETDFNKKYSIPANTLRPGSTIRVKAYGKITSKTGNPTIILRLRVGTTIVPCAGSFAPAVGGTYILEGLVTIQSIGVTGTANRGGSAGFLTSLGNFETDPASGSGETLNTTVANEVKATAQWSAASLLNQVVLHAIMIDVQ